MASMTVGCFVGWLVSGVLGLTGLALFFLVPSYQFSGLILLGLTAALICFLLLIRLSRKYKRPARILQMILSLILIFGLTVAVLVGKDIIKDSHGDEGSPKYIVVLGAGVNGTRPSLSLQERIQAAYEYLTAHPDSIAVVSGAQGKREDITEAQCMYRELVARGIDPDRIIKEEKATNTKENLACSMKLIEEIEGKQPAEIGLVSSDYHLYRAKLFAREQSIHAVGIPARTARLSLRINYFLREIAAVCYYSLFD